jgi:parvulin-like peptidyl-prolyl isomerase
MAATGAVRWLLLAALSAHAFGLVRPGCRGPLARRVHACTAGMQRPTVQGPARVRRRGGEMPCVRRSRGATDCRMAARTASANHILVESEAHCLELKAELAAFIARRAPGAPKLVVDLLGKFSQLARGHSLCPSGVESGGALGEFEDVCIDMQMYACLGASVCVCVCV